MHEPGPNPSSVPPPSPLTGLLSQAVNAGDDRSRNEAWRRLEILLLAMTRGMMRGNDRHEKESMDICHSVVGDLLNAGTMPAFGGEAELKAYLRQAVKNKLREKARGEGAQKRGGGQQPVGLGSGEGDDRSELAAPRTPGPATAAIAREESQAQAAQAEARLDLLDDDARAMLRLHARGLSHGTIAEQLGITHASARQRFVRVQRDLKLLDLCARGAPWAEVAKATRLSEAQATRRHALLLGGGRPSEPA